MFKKRIILKPEDKEDEPPDGLNVVLPFKRLGILNPAIIQHGPGVLIKTKSYER